MSLDDAPAPLIVDYPSNRVSFTGNIKGLLPVLASAYGYA
ncbi:MAG: hypothetical protein ACI87O_001320 [Planctomycetota bacterium]|jgi:hypothetical protein